MTGAFRVPLGMNTYFWLLRPPPNAAYWRAVIVCGPYVMVPRAPVDPNDPKVRPEFQEWEFRIGMVDSLNRKRPREQALAHAAEVTNRLADAGYTADCEPVPMVVAVPQDRPGDEWQHTLRSEWILAYDYALDRVGQL